jgi:Ca2+:H+ antiporter
MSFALRSLARERVFALAMLLGGVRYGEQQYNLKSSTAFFSMILVLAAVGLYLPVVVPAASRISYEAISASAPRCRR